MTDAPAHLRHCPWCGTPALRVWYDTTHSAWRADWLCGAFLHGEEPYRFSDSGCVVNELDKRIEVLEAENKKLRAEVKDLEEIDAEEITSWQALWEYLRKSFPNAPRDEHSPQEIVDWARRENEKLRAVVKKYGQHIAPCPLKHGSNLNLPCSTPISCICGLVDAITEGQAMATDDEQVMGLSSNCFFCGKEYPSHAADEIRKHIGLCSRHPLQREKAEHRETLRRYEVLRNLTKELQAEIERLKAKIEDYAKFVRPIMPDKDEPGYAMEDGTPC